MTNVEFLESDVAGERLDAYVRLFKVCFPDSDKFSKAYLEWLYRDNPSGYVIGVDALHEGEVVAHYAVIPVEVEFAGRRLRACWSLNTATHPDFQGRGLFTRLAEMTYEAAARRGCIAVIGVANKNSTHGFVRKLGFTLLGRLSVTLGYGAQSFLDGDHVMHRAWPIPHQEWRLRNPARTYYSETKGSHAAIFASFGATRTLVALGSFDASAQGIEKLRRPSIVSALQPRIYVGLRTVVRGWAVPLPRRMLPSPWNVIIRLLPGIDYSVIELAMLGIDLDTF